MHCDKLCAIPKLAVIVETDSSDCYRSTLSVSTLALTMVLTMVLIQFLVISNQVCIYVNVHI